METFLEKVKKETKGKYISQLRERLPSLQGSEGRFIHLDKIPRIYPVAEFRRTKDGSWKFKQYNGIVLVEVNNLSGLAEADANGYRQMLQNLLDGKEECRLKDDFQVEAERQLEELFS